MEKKIKTYQCIGIILFLSLFLFQAFQRTFILADYYLETEKYIAQCINKSHPEMHCNGKCQMMKEMTETEHQTPTKSHQENHPVLEVLLFFVEKDIFDFSFVDDVVTYAHYINNMDINNFSSFLFRPPKK